MRAVELRDLKKSYGNAVVLSLDAFDVAAGELFVIVGPSGSGKSTLLRILAGLTKPDHGAVTLFGADAAHVAPHERGVAMVFQGLALWPHLTVRGNIALGLDSLIADRAARGRRIDEVATALGIDALLKRRPHQLSGGERQRVAYARALVRRPRLLLLDEPFSDLDARLRRTAARLLRQLHDDHEMTTLLVTHDRADAHLLADKIGVIHRGNFVAIGRPDVLREHPKSAFAAEFLTDATIVSANATGKTAQSAVGPLTLQDRAHGPVLAALRPDELTIGTWNSSDSNSADQNSPDWDAQDRDGATGVVTACEFAGGLWRCRVEIGSEAFSVLHQRALPKGERVRVQATTAPRTLLTEDR